MKTFSLLRMDNDDIVNFQSKTARDAALKAASKGETFIVLADDEKLHVFRGERSEIAEEQRNDFARAKSMRFKSNVRKMGCTRFDRKIDWKKPADRQHVRSVLYDFIS